MAAHGMKNALDRAETVTAQHWTSIGYNDNEKFTCETLGAEELAAVLDVNARWPYTADQDAWVLTHNSIRFDMAELLAGIDSTLKQVQSGQPMQAWQPANLAKFFPMFYTYVHDHHDHEEKLAFPYLTSRLILPSKMSADHVELMAALDKCGALAKSMKASGNAEEDARQLLAFAAEFTAVQTLMVEHFDEEEQVVLPHFRKHFSQKDFAPIKKEIIASQAPLHLAHMLSPLTTEENKQWMTSVAHIPGFVQHFIILPRCNKYQNEYLRLLQELKAGAKVVTARPQGIFGFLFQRSAAAAA